MKHPSHEDLSAYADGALPVLVERSIADHVMTCETCAGLVRDWSRLRQLVRSAPVVQPEPWFAERMEAMVVGEIHDEERWVGPERVAARAVFGLALVVIGLVIAFSFQAEATQPGLDRELAVGSGDSTTLFLASHQLTRDDLLLAAVGGE